MICRNSNKGINACSVELSYSYEEKGKTKIIKKTVRKKEVEEFLLQMNNLVDERKKLEGFFVVNCLVSGQRIILKSGKIKLFWNEILNPHVSEPSWIITENEELYSLLKNLVQA